jgi:hypothetical protein
LRLCVFAWEWRQQNHSKRGKIQKNTKDTVLKKVFQRALLRICVFMKNLTKSQP